MIFVQTQERSAKKACHSGPILNLFFSLQIFVFISYINQAFVYVIFRYILKKESCTTLRNNNCIPCNANLEHITALLLERLVLHINSFSHY